MRHDPEKLRTDVRLAIEEVERLFRGKTFEDFIADRGLQLIAERELEIIGEALARLRRDHPETADHVADLDKIIGLRNVLAHGYDSLDYEILWDVLENKLEALQSDIKKINL